jgi:Xaa-Pro aminopeptidase
VDITDIFVEKKAPKSEYELSLLKYTCDIAVESFEEVVKFIKPGQTELDIIGMAEGYLRSRGAQELLVLTRSAAPYPFINRPVNKKIADDDIFVYSCECSGPLGYWSQIIRPIFMSKKAHQKLYDVLQIVKEALEAGRRKFVPGNTVADVAIAIEDVVAKNHCETGVWSGHSMGIDLGDGYFIGNTVKMEIKPNMILTMHPSILKDGDGVLYSDTFVSTKGEAINLTGKYTGSPYYEDLIEMVK